jgi:hypothetical protein
VAALCGDVCVSAVAIVGELKGNRMMTKAFEGLIDDTGSSAVTLVGGLWHRHCATVS